MLVVVVILYTCCKICCYFIVSTVLPCTSFVYFVSCSSFSSCLVSSLRALLTWCFFCCDFGFAVLWGFSPAFCFAPLRPPAPALAPLRPPAPCLPAMACTCLRWWVHLPTLVGAIAYICCIFFFFVFTAFLKLLYAHCCTA